MTIGVAPFVGMTIIGASAAGRSRTCAARTGGVNVSSKHTEFLWTLGRKSASGETEIMYRLTAKMSEVYRVAVEEEILGPGWTGKGLALAGWKPVKVYVAADL